MSARQTGQNMQRAGNSLMRAGFSMACGIILLVIAVVVVASLL